MRTPQYGKPARIGPAGGKGKCRKCGVAIVWLRDAENRPVPVEPAFIAEGDSRYVEGRHADHRKNCRPTVEGKAA